MIELTTVTRGSRKSIAASAASSSGRAAAITGEWNAPVTGSATARRPCSRAAAAAASNAPLGARQHDLVGRVVVRDREAGGLGDRSRVLGGALAEQREHRAVARALARLLHQPPARRDEPQPVLGAQRLGGDQRGDLAERVAGVRGAGHAGVAQPLEADDARAVDRRLRVARAVVDARERIVADDLASEREQVGTRRRDVVAHLGGLASLAGEQEGGGLGASLTAVPELPPARIAPTVQRRHSPRMGGQVGTGGGRYGERAGIGRPQDAPSALSGNGGAGAIRSTPRAVPRGVPDAAAVSLLLLAARTLATDATLAGAGDVRARRRARRPPGRRRSSRRGARRETGARGTAAAISPGRTACARSRRARTTDRPGHRLAGRSKPRIAAPSRRCAARIVAEAAVHVARRQGPVDRRRTRRRAPGGRGTGEHANGAAARGAPTDRPGSSARGTRPASDSDGAADVHRRQPTRCAPHARGRRRARRSTGDRRRAHVVDQRQQPSAPGGGGGDVSRRRRACASSRRRSRSTSPARCTARAPTLDDVLVRSSRHRRRGQRRDQPRRTGRREHHRASPTRLNRAPDVHGDRRWRPQIRRRPRAGASASACKATRRSR